jgi:lipoyl(octanoyl) transferase
MPGRWRIIDTGPADPFTNMALDEALLRSYSFRLSPPTLRIYGWDPAALSLGYSQDAINELDIEYCDRVDLPFVRRLTGGGIIRHADEITYSLVCSREDLGAPEQAALSYKVICAFLIMFYKKLGLEAAFACDSAESSETLGEPSVLCFAAKEKYDIVVNGMKIGGSAQKRSRDVIFQHGSIPMAPIEKTGLDFLRDKSAAGRITAVSLGELLGRTPERAELVNVLIESFRSTFGVAVQPGSLSAYEADMGCELRERKYKSHEWNFRRIEPERLQDGHGYDKRNTKTFVDQ